MCDCTAWVLACFDLVWDGNEVLVSLHCDFTVVGARVLMFAGTARVLVGFDLVLDCSEVRVSLHSAFTSVDAGGLLFNRGLVGRYFFFTTTKLFFVCAPS